MPKVSVIIPTYNTEEYIKEAIDSVLNQTYKDFEIIVIDDGSEDNTKAVLEPYIQNGRIRYTYLPHQGRPYARNEGLKQVTGKYLCFLDSDDIMLPQNLELKIKYAEKYNLKLIFSDYYKATDEFSFKELGKSQVFLRDNGFIELVSSQISDCIKEDSFYCIPRPSFLKVAVKNPGLNTNTVFIDSDFLLNQEKATFDLKLLNAQDVDMWCRLIVSPFIDKIGYLDALLAVYRSYNAQWTSNPNREHYLYTWTKRLIDGAEKYKGDIGRSYFAEAAWNMGWLFNKEKDYRRHFFTKALSIYPWRMKYWKSFAGLFLKNRHKLLCPK